MTQKKTSMSEQRLSVVEEDEVSLGDENVAFNSQYFGRPIEELDQFIAENTFCVLSKHFGTFFVNRFSGSNSFWIFTPLSRIRRMAIMISTNQYFDIVIIMTILAQCFLLGSDTIIEYPPGSGQILDTPNRINESPKALAECIFLVVYTLEFLLKIVAKGFLLNKFSYLRNKWNILDFVCVIAGWVTLVIEYFNINEGNKISSLGSLDFLRTFRVLRAFKTISVLPGLRMMINALLRSVVQLIEVMFLTFFCLVIFSLIGLQMFQGKLLQKCIIDKGGIADLEGNDDIHPHDFRTNYDYYKWVSHPRRWLKRAFPDEEFLPCGNITDNYLIRKCPIGYTCLPNLGENPDGGWTNFDNFFSSMLTTFQLISLDFWERPYELVMSVNGWSSLIYFVAVVFFGSFYLLNLMLAVVSMSYEEELSAADIAPKTKYQQLSLHRQDSTFSFDDPIKLNVKLMTKYRKKTPLEKKIMAQRDLQRRENRTDSFEENQIEIEDSQMEAAANDEQNGFQPFVSPQNFHSNDHAFKEKGGIHIRKRVLRKCKQLLKPIVNHWVFDTFITICIVLNTVILSIEHHNEDSNLENILKAANYTFTIIFTLEFLFKLVALQKEYFKSYWNMFDLVIVAASWIEILYVYISPNANASAFGSLRLLCVFKLAQSWITMKILLNIIFSTLGALGNLTIVLMLVIYIFSVLGMQLIGKGYTQKAFCGEIGNPTPYTCDDFPTWRFDHFGYAFMSIFRILCGEWVEAMWECLIAQTEDPSENLNKPNGRWKCFLIFILGTIVGTFIILNLFLALLLNSFNTEEINAQREKELEASGKVENLKTIVGLFMVNPGEIEQEQPNAAQVKTQESLPVHGKKISGKRKFKLVAKRVIMKNTKAAALSVVEKGEKHIMRLDSKTSFDDRDSLLETSSTQLKTNLESCCPKTCWEWNILGFSEFIEICCCWKVWDRVRKICFKIVSHSYFEWFILLLIFFSSIALCFDDVRLENNKNLQLILFNLNTFFTIIFMIEMVLKLTALGFWKYFTNFWCILDAFIVGVNLVTYYFETLSNENKESRKKNLAALKALRALRAFRPLRAISRWQGMRVVVNALIYSIPAIFNVLLVCLLFWFVFSIMGVQLFKGKFFRCINDRRGVGVPYREADAPSDGGKTIHDMAECCEHAETKEYSWINFFPNYDNVFEAYLSLYQVATFEGWMEIMAMTVNSGNVHQNHDVDRQLWYYLFYVVFIVLGSFFTLNLFIGVIIDNFNLLKKKYEGNLIQVFLTPNQRQYYTAMKKLGRKKPKRVITRPLNNFVALFYDIAISQKFEMFTFVIIFFNMIVMGFDYHGQSLFNNDILKAFDFFFVSIYFLEFVIKFIGFRLYYFTVGWNIFDFTLIMFSLFQSFIYEIDSVFDPAIIRVIRVFRIGRILRFIKAAKGIRKLLYALIVSLPALYNIGALLALITFIYAILGMSFFSKAPKHDTYDEFFNFKTFSQSCLVLLRLMTSAGWNEIYDALMQSPEPICGRYRKLPCGGHNEPECINRFLMSFYMISYIAICWNIVINMYIAIILENFEEANKEEDIGIVEDDLDMFYDRWGRYDPKATQFISFDQLSEFLSSLEPPLNIPKPNIVAIVLFNLPIGRGNKIHCLDILHALIKHVIGHVDNSDDFRNLQAQMEKKFKQQFPQRKYLKLISSTRIWKIQHNAAIVIQRAWRNYYAKMHPNSKPIIPFVEPPRFRRRSKAKHRFIRKFRS